MLNAQDSSIDCVSSSKRKSRRNSNHLFRHPSFWLLALFTSLQLLYSAFQMLRIDRQQSLSMNCCITARLTNCCGRPEAVMHRSAAGRNHCCLLLYYYYTTAVVLSGRTGARYLDNRVAWRHSSSWRELSPQLFAERRCTRSTLSTIDSWSAITVVVICILQ